MVSTDRDGVPVLISRLNYVLLMVGRRDGSHESVHRISAQGSLAI
jgi:hypothetical protein